MKDLLDLFQNFTITEEYPIKGYLSEISSPSRLWFQTDDPELIRIDKDLNDYYKWNPNIKSLEEDAVNLHCGMKIAAFICGKWHRVTILSEVRKNRNVCIFADDFGTKGYVHVRLCKPLPEDFMKIPRKSIKACLHGIAPPKDTRLFDIEATQFIINFCYNRLFRIKSVYHHKEEDFHEIVACREDGVILNNHLIEKGFAKPSSENTRFSVFYPSFDLVEKDPLYESYNHRYLYRNCGINYNAFEDEYIDPSHPYKDQLVTLLANEKFAFLKKYFEIIHSVKI